MSEPRSALEVVLLVVHVFAAILFIGPAAVANSVFPQHLRGRLTGRDARSFEPDAAVLVALHRISRRYGRAALVVPLAGALLATLGGRWDEWWLWASIALATVAGVLLVATLRAQRAAMAVVRASRVGAAVGPGEGADASEAGGPSGGRAGDLAAAVRRTAAVSGQFNLAWLAVLVLMVWRPGGSP